MPNNTLTVGYLYLILYKGNIGLIRAVEKFTGPKFIQRMRLGGLGNLLFVRLKVRPGQYAFLLQARWLTGFISHRGSHQDLGKATVEEIAERIQLEVSKVDEALQITKEPISLDTPVADDSESTIGAFIEDVNSALPDTNLIDASLSEELSLALSELSPREEKVLRMRHGLGEPTRYSLEDIGARFCLTRGAFVR